MLLDDHPIVVREVVVQAVAEHPNAQGSAEKRGDAKAPRWRLPQLHERRSSTMEKRKGPEHGHVGRANMAVSGLLRSHTLWSVGPSLEIPKLLEPGVVLGRPAMPDGLVPGPDRGGRIAEHHVRFRQIAP